MPHRFSGHGGLGTVMTPRGGQSTVRPPPFCRAGEAAGRALRNSSWMCIRWCAHRNLHSAFVIRAASGRIRTPAGPARPWGALKAGPVEQDRKWQQKLLEAQVRIVGQLKQLKLDQAAEHEAEVRLEHFSAV